MSDQRKTLEQAVIDAAQALLAAMGSAAFCIPIPGTDPPLYVAAGQPHQIEGALQACTFEAS